jgi:anti-sigma regulatory factor (Ser/Thr protein kinase)
MSRELVLTVKKEITAFRHLSPPFVQFLDEHGVSSTVAYNAKLVLEELVSNAVKYSSQEGFSDAIDVKVAFEEDYLRIRVEYEGVPFDPCNCPPPDLSVPLAERQLGGLGLHLVRNLTDDLSYERIGNCNCVDACIKLA